MRWVMSATSALSSHRLGTNSRQTAKSFWRLMHKVAIVAGATHVMFLGLFYGLGATAMAWLNLGSVLLFGLSYLCLRKRFNLLASSLIVTEILLHAFVAVRAIGWDSGFHYYLLVMVPVAVISQVRVRFVKILVVGTTLSLYVLLDHAMRVHQPWHVLSPVTLSGLRYFNIAVTFLLLSYLSSLYLYLVTTTERQLRTLATTDPLTRLLNRRSLLELADYELVQRHRHHEPLAFVLADIDHFKAINDQHGHAVGDEVLTRVSQSLKQHVREQDSVARWGGEEFLILMPKATVEEACQVAERLRAAMANLDVAVDGRRIDVTMTFGVSAHRAEEPLDATLRRADAALYEGKTHGRNQVTPEAA